MIAQRIGIKEAQAPKTLVVGLGKTGLSCARFLAARGISYAVNDSRAEPPGLEELTREQPDVHAVTGGFDQALFEVADRLVVSPGVPVTEPFVQAAARRGAEILGDIELFAREAKAPVIAITGSNGKTTVTTLLGDMAQRAGLRAAVGGNIGQPALDLLAPDVELYILELSSFQLETTQSLRAEAAVVLNVSPDHMDRYPMLEDYANAKARVYRKAVTSVVNLDDPRVRAMPGGRHRVGYSLEEPRDGDFGIRESEGRVWLSRGGQLLLSCADLPIAGSHNQANALAALALGTAVGLPLPAMLDSLREFRGLPHRTRLVAEINEVRWYNDSKGTNVGACIAALVGLDTGDDSRSVLIAGGDCKGASFAELGPVAERYARAVVLIGRDAEMVAAELVDRVPVVRARDMGDAVRHAAAVAKPGDRVLLSPACASFDMFRDFEHRGEVFESLVHNLEQGEGL